MAATNLDSPIRVLIVDDEPLARELLQKLLSDKKNFEIVGECRDGRQVLDAVKRTNADLILMDVQMPGLTGIEAAFQLRQIEPLIVFVTAYEQHAVEAFAARGFQYLVKPVSKPQFDEMLVDASREIRRRRIEKLYNANDHVGGGSDFRNEEIIDDVLEYIKVRAGSQIHILDVRSVYWFEAANQYVRIHSVRGDFLISSTSLNALEEKIDKTLFVRAHRSALINKRFVRSVKLKDGAYYAELATGDKIKISRRNKGEATTALLTPGSDGND